MDQTNIVDISDREVQFYEDVLAYVKRVSSQCFRDFLAPESPCTVCPIPDEEIFNFDHWVTTIVVPLEFATIGVKAHYPSRMMRPLVAKKLDIPGQVLPAKLLHDTAEEYLNLIMGSLKQMGESSSSLVSVPTTAPTEDMSDPRFTSMDSNSSSWKLVWEESFIYLSCHIKLLMPISLIPKVDFSAKDQENSFELL